MIDDERALNKPLIGIAIAVLIAASGGWWFWHSRQTPPPASAAAAPPAPDATAAPDAISHPVPAASGVSATPLPELVDSDAPFGAALGDAGGGDATRYLVPTDLIRHIVVTVDNLLRQKAAVEKRPTTPVPGTFIADGDELHATLDARNFKRYTPMVDALGKVDMQRMVNVYLRFYPLFQKAYQALGYPTGYFNDRLVQVIDGLLATPQVNGPIELVRPNVMYVFADPGLEARPAGQKMLIRMGPDNETAVKAKLTELRADLIAASPKR